MTRLIGTALLALTLASPAMAETRNLTGFNAIGAGDRVEVIVAVGPAYAVEVTGRDAARVRTRLDGRTLRITQANHPWWGGDSRRIDAAVRVTMPRVEGLSASRGASVTATDIVARSMSLAASMGGEIRVSGTCTTLSAAASMGGVIQANNFRCANADVAASMGGDARVFASESFDASASMGGAINVAGDPERRETSAVMGGSVSSN